MLMLGPLVAYSTVSLFFSLGNAVAAPFLFVAIVKFFISLTLVIYLLIAAGKKMTTIVAGTKSHWRSWKLAGVTLGQTNDVFLAFSLLYIDVAVASILAAARPFFYTLIVSRAFNRQGRYEKITGGKWALTLLAVVGCGLVIASQSRYFGAGLTFATLIGVLLALANPLFSGFTSLSLKWGTDVSTALGDEDTESLFPLVGAAIGLFASSILFFAIGYFLQESFGALGFGGVAMAVGYAVIAGGLGDTLHRSALLKTSNLGVNSLGFFQPALAIVWLGAFPLIPQVDWLLHAIHLQVDFPLITVPHVDWLIAGCIAVVAANLLLNFRASDRIAYKALVIILWASGLFVYLHDGVVAPHYFAVVNTAALVFVLLLTFRMERLIRRTADEENNAFTVFRQLETLVRYERIKAEVLEGIKEIDKHRKVGELRNAYRRVKDLLHKARDEPTGGDTRMADKLERIESAVDKLAHSKQQGTNFGEFLALGAIGVILAGLLLFFTAPDLGAYPGYGFMVELMSFVLASIIVFLLFNMWDLERDRRRPILFKEKDGRYHVHFWDDRDADDAHLERRISIIICLAMVVAYGALLYYKWLL